MEKYEPLKIEEEILKFWAKNKIYEKQKLLGKNGPKFYWLCGPPYTSGKFHVGHFWNYASLKDPLFRYKRMRGFDVWDRGGWDMHGLPTSRKVMAKLGLKTKEDIEKYGVDKFVKECEKFSKETMEKMTEDYIRWGVWFDHKNAYQPITNEFMEGVWWGIKKAWENGFLYEGEKVMAWCPESETVAAKHELEYKEVTDDSIYLKFKVKGKDKTYLIIWTTTPWTIPFNLAVMANPEINYVYAKAGDETWIIAKDLLESVSKAAKVDLKVTKEVKGKELEGLEYEPLLEKEIPKISEIKKKHDWAFKVVLSKEYVDTESGSGLVHCAPGCGPEDQEVGKRYKLPPFNEVDSKGYFPKSMGIFEGWRARFDDKKFIEYFKKIGALVARAKYKHEYPFHERSKAPVIFRTTKQWFFAVEKIKDKLKEWNKQVNWIPKWAGEKTFDNWIFNLKDISITRQRYWGTPIPIWKCDKCNHFVVVGSLDELKKLSGKKPKSMHKPWIDEITFKCDKCKKGTMKRIPDIADVWLDAGCTSWISLYFPQRKDLMEKYWPADFILEAKEQIRGWFNLLFDTAGVTGLGIPFTNAYMTGWVNDAQGRKMSKSLGNIIDPYEVVGKYGTDTVRFYMMGAAQPGVDMNYNHKDIAVKFRNLSILWNIHNFLIDFVKTNKLKIPKNPNLGLEEKYILSRTHSTLKKVTELYDEYRLNEIPWEIEKLFLDISRVYIKSIRDKAAMGTKEEKEAIAYTLFESLITTLKMFGTVAPFICEKMYQNLRKVFGLKPISIQLFEWPEPNEELIDEKIEKTIEIANEVITAILSIRDKKGIGVRWPLSKVLIITPYSEYVKTAKEIILKQCNLKDIEFIEKEPSWVKLQVKVNHGKMAKKFKEKVPKIVGTLIQMSPEAVRKALSESGKVLLEVDGEKYELTPEEIYIEEELPDNWGSAEIDHGKVYLSLEQNKELLSEGFAREIARRIQDLRKELKLQKTDKAKAKVLVDEELKEMLEKYIPDVEKRTGTTIEILTKGNINEKANVKVKVKNKEIVVGLSPKKIL
ncbi:MAG: isoleucine--tRNA ligase [Nanoarchaeota archaeon]|nr:isoleucine--tRNA ligase [Nanoarchaeota archaeon]